MTAPTAPVDPSSEPSTSIDTLDTATAGPSAPAWRRFVAWFAGVGAAAGCAALAFVALLDPYGLFAAPGRAPGPLMDSNQRFLYPQIVRSGTFDAAVIGTSTSRLLDPRDLDAAFGVRFANLAMNAATPWEQTQAAWLFLRHASPRAMLFGLDPTWCAPDADRHRLTFRPFPLWLYQEGAPFAALRQVNWRSLTIAAGVAMNHLGLAPARIRGDGFAVFTPPEPAYDAARARAHIHSGKTALDDPDAPEAEPRMEGIEGDMPALGWLDALLAALPKDTLKLVAFMPVNVAAQGPPGTSQAAREAVCKARVARIGAQRGASVIDFRIPSPVTTDDANYWDALHYRLPIAARIVAGLKAAQDTGRSDADGFYRVLSHP